MTTTIDAATPTETKDETIDRTTWTPDEAQFARYRQREVEMCVASIRRHNDKFHNVDALFSQSTWEAARKEILNTPE